jgi:hypothetical protein
MLLLLHLLLWLMSYLRGTFEDQVRLRTGAVIVIVGSRGLDWHWRYMGLGNECHGLARWGYSR